MWSNVNYNFDNPFCSDLGGLQLDDDEREVELCQHQSVQLILCQSFSLRKGDLSLNSYFGNTRTFTSFSRNQFSVKTFHAVQLRPLLPSSTPSSVILQVVGPQGLMLVQSGVKDKQKKRKMRRFATNTYLYNHGLFTDENTFLTRHQSMDLSPQYWDQQVPNKVSWKLQKYMGWTSAMLMVGGIVMLMVMVGRMMEIQIQKEEYEGETKLKVVFFFFRFRKFNHQTQISPRQATLFLYFSFPASKNMLVLHVGLKRQEFHASAQAHC